MERKPKPAGWARRAAGDVLLVLAASLMIYLAVVMHHRIQTVVLAGVYRRVLLNEELLCFALLLAAADMRFGLLTRLSWPPLRALGWAVRLLAAGTALLFLFLVGRVVVVGLWAPSAAADRVIVLGMALEDGKPTRDLLCRLDTARGYAQDHPESVLILTGGNPDAQGRTEAAVMRDILLADGFPAERMVLEDRAGNTMENFKNTAALIDPEAPVVLVSSNYHMRRALATAGSAGFTRVIPLPAPSSAADYAANVMWEVSMELNTMTRGIMARR